MNRDFKEIPGYVAGIVKELRDLLFETASRVKSRLSVEGKPIRYPVNWDSERQRVFVIAKLRRENNLPYKRTHATRLSLQVSRVPVGALLDIPHPGGAVFGLPSGWQSRIHRGRWPYLLEVLFDELSRLPAEISNRIKVFKLL